MATAQVILQLQQNVAPQVRSAADAYKQLSTEEQKAERAALQYATAQQRANAVMNSSALSAQKLQAAEQRTAQATAQAAAASTRAESAAFRFAQAQEKAASSSGSLTSQISGLKTAAGALGVAFGAQQVIQFGIAAAQSALSLRETQNSLRAVAGSAENYNRVIATAREQQVLFGGTLEENIQGLTGLTITARQSGADLKQLIDISQRLGTLDPSQGVAGARIALSEALSGDPTSLAKRYEIPKAALAKLRDESTSSADKLKIVDEYLNKIGITSESVAGKVDEQARTFRESKQAIDDATIALGGLLANGLAPAARGLTRVLSGDLDAMKAGFVAAAGDGNAAFATFDAVLGGALSRQAGLIRATTAQAEAQTQTNAVTQQATDIEGIRAERLAASAALTQQATNAQLGYANALELTGVQARAAAVVQQQKADADAVANTNRQTAAIAEKQLDDAAQKAARAMIASGVAGARAAALLSDTSGIDQRTAAYYRLFAAQQAVANGPEAKAAARATDFSERHGGDLGVALTPAQRAQQAKDQATAAAIAQAEAAAKAEEARRNQIRQTGTAAQKLALAQKEYQEAVARSGKGSAEAINAQTALISAQNAARTAGAREAKSHTSELNKQLSLEEGIRDSKEKQLKASLDAQAAVIRDRQERRKEDQEIATAQRILGSGRARPDIAAAAQDRLALIGIERQQRALAIGEQQATAGASIVNGRLLQSRPGAGGVAGAPGPLGAVPLAPNLAPVTPEAAAGAAGIDVLVYLDGQQIAANVVTRLRAGHRGVPSAGVGQAVPNG